MNSDWAAELASLIADTRALAEDARVRGVRDVERTPAGAPAAPHHVEAAADPAGLARWSEVAASAREEELPAPARLAKVREDLGDCRRCNLAKGRKQIVFGVGSPEADLVVVGEAPGFHEDQQGEPFVGPAGQMLDRMLDNVLELSRSQVYILNVVKCRPPKNRNPLPDEVSACHPFLMGQIEAIRPRVLLVLGSVAFRAVFDTPQGITRGRGRWRDLAGIPAMATFHPAYLLRNPNDKRLTFEDLKAVRRRYDELGGRRES